MGGLQIELSLGFLLHSAKMSLCSGPAGKMIFICVNYSRISLLAMRLYEIKQPVPVFLVYSELSIFI